MLINKVNPPLLFILNDDIISLSFRNMAQAETKEISPTQREALRQVVFDKIVIMRKIREMPDQPGKSSAFKAAYRSAKATLGSL